MTDSERLAKIAALKELMNELYLSTACAAEDHRECRLVHKYSGLVCCCATCDHEGRSPKNKLLTGPLLHHASTPAEQLPDYVYRGGVGRRVDLLKLASRLAMEARRDLTAPVLFDFADQIALLFAPRLG